MRSFGKVTFAAAISVGALAFTAGNASADIVCNDDGDCWHAHEHYDYPAGAGIVVHHDDWAWGPEARYRWREHEGRGYWHGDDWTPF